MGPHRYGVGYEGLEITFPQIWSESWGPPSREGRLEILLLRPEDGLLVGRPKFRVSPEVNNREEGGVSEGIFNLTERLIKFKVERI